MWQRVTVGHEDSTAHYKSLNFNLDGAVVGGCTQLADRHHETDDMPAGLPTISTFNVASTPTIAKGSDDVALFST